MKVSTVDAPQHILADDGSMRGAPVLPAGLSNLDRVLAHINSASHMLAAFWLFGIALTICLDVLSRAFLNAPFAGTAEIVANSVVSIVFLQLPSAVRSGGMLRAEILDIYLSASTLARLHAFGCFLGAVLFCAVAYTAWGPMVEAWNISERAGNESTVEIPLFPIRLLLVAMSLLAAANFMLMSLTGGKPSVLQEVAHGKS